jgi:hypothetical protein
MEELVTRPGGLLSRGLSQDDATHYGALPRRKQERAPLAGILNEHVRVHFPDYAKFHSGAGVSRRTRILAGTIWDGPHLETAQLPDAASGNTV